MKKILQLLAMLSIGSAMISCATREAAKEEEMAGAETEVPVVETESGVATQMPSDIQIPRGRDAQDDDGDSGAKIVEGNVALANTGVRSVMIATTDVSGAKGEAPLSRPGELLLTNSVSRGGYRYVPESPARGTYAGEWGFVKAYPTELYTGENVVTFSSIEGIRSIEPLFDDVTASLTEIAPESIGTFRSCVKSHKVKIRVNTASVSLNVRFRVIDSAGKSQTFAFNNRTWRLDEVSFRDVMVGDTTCRPFQIGLAGFPGLGSEVMSEYLDSVSITIPQAFIRYTTPPPLGLRSGSTYRYEVCFAPTEPGLYRFPVITWIRRAQPAEGYTNYPVADTAVVRVLKFKQY